MKIIFTKHSLQRRPHLKIQNKKEFLPWLRFFIDFFSLKDKKDSLYKIYYKGSTVILKKNNNKLIIITLWGLKDFSKKEFFKIREVEPRINVYRINYVGREVICGKIENDILYLNDNLRRKYVIQFPFKGKITEKFEDYIHEKNNKYYLNDFKRTRRSLKRHKIS